MTGSPIYRSIGDGPTVRCRWCGESRIIPGRIAAHLASVGHPTRFNFDRPEYRALLAAVSGRPI